VSGAWVFALLQQSEQSEDGFSGELCAESRAAVCGKVGGLDRDAEAHEVSIGHDHMARSLRRMTDRDDGEASAEQRVSGIGYFDLVRRPINWVLE
jgi:hypothetical protein